MSVSEAEYRKAVCLAEYQARCDVRREFGIAAEPIGTATASPTNALGFDPVARWKAALAIEKDRGLSNRSAVQAANRKHPGLRLQMLAAINGR